MPFPCNLDHDLFLDILDQRFFNNNQPCLWVPNDFYHNLRVTQLSNRKTRADMVWEMIEYEESQGTFSADASDFFNRQVKHILDPNRYPLPPSDRPSSAQNDAPNPAPSPLLTLNYDLRQEPLAFPELDEIDKVLQEHKLDIIKDYLIVDAEAEDIECCISCEKPRLPITIKDSQDIVDFKHAKKRLLDTGRDFVNAPFQQGDNLKIRWDCIDPAILLDYERTPAGLMEAIQLEITRRQSLEPLNNRFDRGCQVS